MIRSDSFKLLSWLLETFVQYFLDTLYLTQANGMFLRRILCGKCADSIVFIDMCVIRSEPLETRSDRFL